MIDLDKNALKPCPFCGETPDASKDYTFGTDQGSKWGYVVCCCSGPEVRTGYEPIEKWKADAIAAWNTRATPHDAPPDVADNDALVERLENEASARAEPGVEDALVDLLREAAARLKEAFRARSTTREAGDA